jgi:integrase
MSSKAKERSVGKITKRSVDALKPGPKGEATLWDTEIKGFGVRARKGGSKTYIVRYRPGAGGRDAPLRTLTIGRQGSPWTPAMARSEAKRLLGLVEDGKDPASDRGASRAGATVRELAERFLVEHVQAKRKDRTAEEYRRLIDRQILPAIGALKAADVARRDIAKLHHALRETPYQANRVLAVASKMFQLAEAWGIRPEHTNPCRLVERFPEEARERLISPEELAYLGDALAADSATYSVAAIKLLIFTGARLSEVLALRWEWIDFERAEVRLPDSKTGRKTIHLPAPALAVLNELPRVPSNPFVIVGAVKGECLVNLEKPWRRIRDRASIAMWRQSQATAVVDVIKAVADGLKRPPRVAECRRAAAKAKIELPPALTDVRLHDLRHAFASVAAAAGMGLPIIGKMLGHASPATTHRYAHLASDPVKAAAASVAGKIAGAMMPRQGAEVLMTGKK